MKNKREKKKPRGSFDKLKYLNFDLKIKIEIYKSTIKRDEYYTRFDINKF